MSDGLTLKRAQERLEDYLNAEVAILAAQEYTLATGQKITKTDLKQIQSGIKYWREVCSELKTDEASNIGFYQGRVK